MTDSEVQDMINQVDPAMLAAWAARRREVVARAIYAKRPDCRGKPWPLESAEQRRAYQHNKIAAVDLCFEYADAAIEALSVMEREI